jgi:hypothetical protein
MNGLKKSQYDMFNVVVEFLTNPDVEAVTTSIPQVDTSVTTFLGKLVVIDELKAKLSEDITGQTKTKNNLRKLLNIETFKIAKAIHYYSTSLPVINEELKAKTKFKESYYKKQNQDTIADIALSIHDLAAELITVTPPATNPLAPMVDSAILVSFLQQITDYKNSVPKPRTAISDRKADNDLLEKLITELAEMLTNQLDPLLAQFTSEAVEDNFYKKYRNTRAMVDPYTVHSGFRGTITDAATGESLIEIATGRAENTVNSYPLEVNKTKKEKWVIYTLKYRAFYTLTFEVPGYHTVQILHKKPTRGEKITIDVKMSPVS